MPHILTRSRDNPEFARVVEVARLPRDAEFPFDLEPAAEEADALARLLGVVSVRALRFAGHLRPAGAGWDLKARLTARVAQRCVVTLEPVTARVDQTVRRRFLPAAAPAGAEVEVSPEDDDELEPLGSRIDLGRVATEALALALPDYPRKPGARLGERVIGPEPSPDPEEAPGKKPFAALAALRDRMGGGS